jgi:hypothetical protein
MTQPADRMEQARRPVAGLSWVAAGGILLYLVLVTIGLLFEISTGTPSIVGGWLLFVFLWAALIGWLILRRYPSHPIGWILWASMMLFGALYVSQGYAIYAASAPPGAPFAEVAAWLGFWLLLPVISLLCFYLPLLFPDGRLPSARWRPVAWLAATLTAAGILYTVVTPNTFAREGFPTIRNPTVFAPASGVVELIGLALNSLYLVVALLCLLSVFARLRRAEPTERLQIKWFSYAAVLLFVSFVVGVLSEAFPDLEALDEVVSAVAVTALPTAVGIAVLRYRLYDIDLLINRTVVYFALTGVLAGVYTASIALFQRVFVATTGQSSDVAIVMAIFVLATVFTPIRTRLQAGVDHYFRVGSDGTPAAFTTVLDDIERLAHLHTRGVLTDEEFAAKKRQLLGL